MENTTPKLNVLISLYKGYGLGDAVQMSSVLRHLSKYRPHWVIYYRAEEGFHQVGRGIVYQHFAYGSEPTDVHYDCEATLCLYDTWANWGDRPNTRVSSCLHERFGLPWDIDCGRYQVEVRPCSAAAARTLLYGWSGNHSGTKVKGSYQRTGLRYVAVHYEGDSSQHRKNLTHGQADEVCKVIERLGFEPLILDWRDRCPLPYRRLTTPRAWGRDAEMVCAVIAECSAFIGIDSGPGKCASATDTPALITWTGHSPLPFHDPAPNTTHLVPRNYDGCFPVVEDEGVRRWFDEHYLKLEYDRNPVEMIGYWLREVLR